MPVLEDISQAVRTVADRVGPAVVGLGRGWGRGSGVVWAPGTVLTNAHNLRGDEVTVTFADGRTAGATVAGVDPGGDLAALAVDTGDVEPVTAGDPPPPRGGPGGIAPPHPGGRPRRARRGLGRDRARQPRRARPARHARLRLGHRPQLPRPARAADPRLDRAHRAAAARLVGWAAARRGGQAARAQRRADGRW